MASSFRPSYLDEIILAQGSTQPRARLEDLLLEAASPQAREEALYDALSRTPPVGVSFSPPFPPAPAAAPPDAAPREVFNLRSGQQPFQAPPPAPPLPAGRVPPPFFAQADAALAKSQSAANRAIRDFEKSQGEISKAAKAEAEEAFPDTSREEIDAARESLGEDRRILLDKLESLKPAKDSVGKSIGKAVAVALGAFGSALTRSPNTALQVLESSASRASQQLAADRDKAFKLLGLNEQQRKEIDQKYKSKAEFRMFLENSFYKRAESLVDARLKASSSMREQADLSLAKAKIQSSLEASDAQLAMKLAEQRELEKIYSPENLRSIEIPVRLDRLPDQGKEIRELDVGLSEAFKAYSDIQELLKLPHGKFSPKDRETRAKIDRILVSLEDAYRAAKNYGVPQEFEIARSELKTKPYEYFFSKRGMGELALLTTGLIDPLRDKARTLGGDLRREQSRKYGEMQKAIFQ